MSANNWDECPRCLKKLANDVEKFKGKVALAYGKVSVGEYLAMQAELKKMEKERPGAALREDYELGVQSNGEFFVNYRCECVECGFEFGFKHTQPVKLDKEKRRE
jgi:hypothetical protein